ncbi:hypothetical protein A5806_001381 [Enterococcus faecium]|nr:hypothetical protein A5806_001381 [Enterococcus faecium]
MKHTICLQNIFLKNFLIIAYSDIKKAKKWFGVLMSVPEEKIYDDASDHRIINILDLKVDPELGGILRGKEGYFPAYHMNKEHWISIDLRKIEKLDELADLIDGSFKSTQ